MKKSIRVLYICLFVLAICLPVLSWPVTRHYIGQSNTENRELAARPSLSRDSYASFSTDFDAYFNDHLPYRSKLVQLAGAIDMDVFGISSNEDVVIGKDGWYFYASTVEDYLHTNLYSDEELAEIADSMKRVQNYFDERGIEFVVLIVPNKNSIYGEYMPTKYRQQGNDSRTEQMIAYLQEHTETTLVYPKQEMVKLKDDLPGKELYFHLDSHWNYYGAYVGAQQLLSAVGIAWPDAENISIESMEWKDGHDLTNLLGISGKVYLDTNYSVKGFPEGTFFYENEWGLDTPAVRTYQRSMADGGDDRKLMFIRDSFGTFLMRFVAGAFSEAYSPHIEYFSLDQIDTEQPDIVVLELAERRDLVAYLGQYWKE